MGGHRGWLVSPSAMFRGFVVFSDNCGCMGVGGGAEGRQSADDFDAKKGTSCLGTDFLPVWKASPGTAVTASAGCCRW